jgi:hypothetical protein
VKMPTTASVAAVLIVKLWSRERLIFEGSKTSRLPTLACVIWTYEEQGQGRRISKKASRWQSGTLACNALALHPSPLPTHLANGVDDQVVAAAPEPGPRILGLKGRVSEGEGEGLLDYTMGRCRRCRLEQPGGGVTLEFRSVPTVVAPHPTVSGSGKGSAAGSSLRIAAALDDWGAESTTCRAKGSGVSGRGDKWAWGRRCSTYGVASSSSKDA